MNDAVYKNRNIEHEYDITEILSISWNIFKRNYTHFFTVIFVFFFPIYLINSFFFPEPTDLFANMSLELDFLWGVLLEGFISMIATIAVAFSISDAYHGAELNFSTAFQRTITKILPALLTMLMVALLVMAGAVFFVIPGLIVAVYLNFVIYVVALKNLWSSNALKYSFFLVKDRFWRVLGYILIFGIINIFITGILLSLIGLFEINEVVDSVFKTLVALINGYFYVVMSVYFMNLDDTRNFEFVD